DGAPGARGVEAEPDFLGIVEFGEGEFVAGRAVADDAPPGLAAAVGHAGGGGPDSRGVGAETGGCLRCAPEADDHGGGMVEGTGHGGGRPGGQGGGGERGTTGERGREHANTRWD